MHQAILALSPPLRRDLDLSLSPWISVAPTTSNSDLIGMTDRACTKNDSANADITFSHKSGRWGLAKSSKHPARSILGKSGVGKSSLIQKRLISLDLSDTERGQAVIDKEYTTLGSNRFTVRDSRGFEAADHGDLDNICNFIKDQRCMRHLRDRLHAVWLCLNIPFAGGRAIETGIEEFLEVRDKILGKVPLVVVFAQLDSLVDMLKAEALQVGKLLDDDGIKKQTQESLEKHCSAPLRKAAGNDDVPHVFVSVKDGYQESLSLLVEKTTQNIRTYVKDEAPQYIAAIAQRASISRKVEDTIAVGEEWYRKTLKTCQNSEGHTMKECLDTLHDKIIIVWNFKDPQRSLYGETFKGGLLKTPERKVRAMQIFSKTSQDFVRKLMAYIVDLAHVLQILSFVTPVEGQVSDTAIAMKAYEDTHRHNVHADINHFCGNLSVGPGKQDEVFDKIKELICKYGLLDKDIFELQHQLHGSAGVPSGDQA